MTANAPSISVVAPPSGIVAGQAEMDSDSTMATADASTGGAAVTKEEVLVRAMEGLVAAVCTSLFPVPRRSKRKPQKQRGKKRERPQGGVDAAAGVARLKDEACHALNTSCRAYVIYEYLSSSSASSPPPPCTGGASYSLESVGSPSGNLVITPEEEDQLALQYHCSGMAAFADVMQLIVYKQLFHKVLLDGALVSVSPPATATGGGGGKDGSAVPVSAFSMCAGLRQRLYNVMFADPSNLAQSRSTHPLLQQHGFAVSELCTTPDRLVVFDIISVHNSGGVCRKIVGGDDGGTSLEHQQQVGVGLPVCAGIVAPVQLPPLQMHDSRRDRGGGLSVERRVVEVLLEQEESHGTRSRPGEGVREALQPTMSGADAGVLPQKYCMVVGVPQVSTSATTAGSSGDTFFREQQLHLFQVDTAAVSYKILHAARLHPILWQVTCAAKFVHHQIPTVLVWQPSPSSQSLSVLCSHGNDARISSRSYVFAVILCATFLAATVLQKEEAHETKREAASSIGSSGTLLPLTIESHVLPNLPLTSIFNAVQTAMYHFSLAVSVLVGSSSVHSSSLHVDPPLEILDGSLSSLFLEVWGDVGPGLDAGSCKDMDIKIYLKIFWNRVWTTYHANYLVQQSRTQIKVGAIGASCPNDADINCDLHCTFFVEMASIIHQFF